MVNGVQGVLDYRDLDYRNFTIQGSIKYFIYGRNSSIIGISILEIVVPKLLGFRLSGTFFGPSHPNNRGPPVVLIKPDVIASSFTNKRYKFSYYLSMML